MDEKNNIKKGDEMPIPCEQADVISAIQKTVEYNREAAERSASRIETSIGHFVTQQERFLSKMEHILIEDREHKVRIENLEKSANVLFDLARESDKERKACVEKKIDPLISWKSDINGKLSAIRAVPIICVIITTLIALFTLVHEVHDAEQQNINDPNKRSTYGVGNNERD